MSRATCIRRLHRLVIRPDDVSVVRVDGGHWLTDRYVLFDLAGTETSPAWNGGPAGRWKLRASQPPVPFGRNTSPPPDITCLLDKAATAKWAPLTITNWALCAPNGQHHRLLYREDGQPVTVDSDLLRRWDESFPTGLVLHHTTDAGAAPVLRVSVRTSYTTADYTREDSTRLAGYIATTRATLPAGQPPGATR